MGNNYGIGTKIVADVVDKVGGRPQLATAANGSPTTILVVGCHLSNFIVLHIY